MELIDPPAVGRYAVVSRLGAGAMGVVYLCQDPLLKRRVAVKIVQKTRSDSDTMIARFQRESEISAQLNHPNIITIFDVGNDPEVGPFLCMEFIDGVPLSKHLEHGPLDPETTLDWLSQIGRALAAAERGGVVHRDIKPENILASRDGQMKLTDFGLARDDDSSLTQTGTMMGTPTHTAPELLGGDRATFATDRWAFAVMAFQMTLGRLPHPGDTLSAVLSSIAHEQPAIPEGTPAPLARVFLKALHKDPARRHDSILALLTALADAMGMREKLSTKGLAVEAQAPTGSNPPRAARPDETEAFSLPPPGSSGPPAPPPPPAAKPRASAPPASARPPTVRLTGPPQDLLKAADSSAERQPQHQSHPQAQPRSSSPQGIPLAQPSGKSFGRGYVPVNTPIRRDRNYNFVWVIVLVLGVAGFFLYPRTLTVTTVPPMAQVSVDGKPVGKSPYEGSISFGTHMLEVSMDGYDTVIRPIRGGDSPLDLALLPSSNWVDIKTEPEGATVTLGGRLVGTSPCKGVTVPDRTAPLEITKSGFRRWQGVLGPGRKPPEIIRLQRER